MKTDELVTLLAASGAPADPFVIARRFAIAIGWGAFGSALLMALLLGVRPDIRAAVQWPMFWIKLVFALLLVGAGLFASLRLARPGASLTRLPAALAGPVVAIWLLAVYALATAEPAMRAELIFGRTWRSCPSNIIVLSVPAFVAIFWAMRGLAPTRLRLAGAGAGLLAGAVGASVYALHCPELAAPFIGVWYVAGILAVTTFGALVGPWALRW